MIVYIDFETRSRVDLKSGGTDRYFTEAEPTVCTMAVDNGPVRCWDIISREPTPVWFLDAVANPHSTFVAHNAAFDRCVMERLLFRFTRPEQWQCTRAQSYAHGLPGALDTLCRVLDVGADLSKIADGKRLIQFFCIPKGKDGHFNEPTDYPEEWAAFKEYACRDIDALRAVHRRLPTHNYVGKNLEYFWLDSKINERGFAVDLELIEAATRVLDKAKRDGDVEVAKSTGGEVTAITQRDRLLRYLQAKGLTLPNLTKAELENALQRDDLSPEQRLLISARLEGARASGSKYKRALKMHVGGRLRYTQQFSGAGRTGRTAHKGFQPGNMPRAVTYNPLAATLAEQHVPVKAKYIDAVILPAIRAGHCDPLLTGGPNTACANALRHCIIAEEGNELIVADYKNIESVVLAWLADEPEELQTFRDSFAGVGLDAYKKLWLKFFGGRIEDVNDHKRNAAKVIKLACGFGGSVGALVTMAVSYGMDLSDLPAMVLPSADAKSMGRAENTWWRAFLQREDYDLEPSVYIACHVLVQAYRRANPRIDALKKAVGRAVENAVKLRGAAFTEVGRCKIFANADVLIVELPSGYRLNYWSPEWHAEEVIDPETGEIEERGYLSFKRARGQHMIRERSWPGLILENIVQSTANQVFRYGKIEVDKLWPDSLVLGIHDEAVAEAARGSIPLKEFEAALCKGWWWTKGLPLAADGWVGPRYGKR